MRALPTQHYWNVYFDRFVPLQIVPLSLLIPYSLTDNKKMPNPQPTEHTLLPSSNSAHKSSPSRISGVIIIIHLLIRSRCANPYICSSKAFSQCGRIDGMWMEVVGRSGCQKSMGQISGPGYSWWLLGRRFRVVWIRVCLYVPRNMQVVYWWQFLGDQLCGVGLSVRFNSHLISIWHREGSRQKSIDAILALVLDELPDELKPKPDNYFYKKHSDHAGFKAPADPVPVAATVKVPVVAVEPPKDGA